MVDSGIHPRVASLAGAFASANTHAASTVHLSSSFITVQPKITLATTVLKISLRILQNSTDLPVAM